MDECMFLEALSHVITDYYSSGLVNQPVFYGSVSSLLLIVMTLFALIFGVEIPTELLNLHDRPPHVAIMEP